MNSVRVQRTADRENITVIRKEFNLPKNKKKINFYNWPLSLKKKQLSVMLITAYKQVIAKESATDN